MFEGEFWPQPWIIPWVNSSKEQRDVLIFWTSTVWTSARIKQHHRQNILRGVVLMIWSFATDFFFSPRSQRDSASIKVQLIYHISNLTHHWNFFFSFLDDRLSQVGQGCPPIPGLVGWSVGLPYVHMPKSPLTGHWTWVGYFEWPPSPSPLYLPIFVLKWLEKLCRSAFYLYVQYYLFTTEDVFILYFKLWVLSLGTRQIWGAHASFAVAGAPAPPTN